jgi:hypothetical protein
MGEDEVFEFVEQLWRKILNPLDEVVHRSMDWSLGEIVDECVEKLTVKGEEGIRVMRHVNRKWDSCYMHSHDQPRRMH